MSSNPVEHPLRSLPTRSAGTARRGGPAACAWTSRAARRRTGSIHHFTRCDTLGADIARGEVDEDGNPLGDHEVESSTWRELQAHASFPADQTQIAAEDLDSPMGVLSCLRYTVLDEAGHATFWFAESIAGMPVKVETRTPAGELTSTVTMIANDLP